MAIERDRDTRETTHTPQNTNSILLPVLVMIALLVGAFLMFVPRPTTTTSTLPERTTVQERTIPTPSVPSTVPSTTPLTPKQP